jgi:hypothetical protein
VTGPIRARRCTLERVLRKVDRTRNEHWLFNGALNSHGHGSIRVWEDGRWVVRKAHRVVYEYLVGPIPEGEVLRHGCDIRHCVNPDCLEPGTQSQNMPDMIERGRGKGQFTRALEEGEAPF